MGYYDGAEVRKCEAEGMTVYFGSCVILRQPACLSFFHDANHTAPST